MGFGVAQKIESRARHLNNEWIDFEKCEPIAWLSVSCQRSRAQSDDSHADAAAFVSLIQGHSGARLRPIVSSGFGRASRFEDFDPVHDRSIHEIENSQVPGLWFKPCEFSVANHATDNKTDAEERNLQGRPSVDEFGRKRINHSRECHRKETQKKRALIRTSAVKANDQAEQIE